MSKRQTTSCLSVVPKSGKSALFAALNIGLGGRGNQNERGNAVKQYIKDGQNRTKIRIVLTNRGFGRHPDYGDAIAIERTISLTSSTYQLKSLTYEKEGWRGRVLLKLQIKHQIRNNNLILMFMSATGLDFSRQCYNESEIYSVESEKVMLSVQQVCCNKIKEIEKLREDRKRVQNMEQNKQNLADLKNILRWLPIRDCRKDICKHNELLAKAIEVYTKLKKGYTVKEKIKADCLQKFEQIQKNKNKLQEKLKNIRAELNNLGKEKKNRHNEMLDVGQQLSIVERNHRILDAEIGSMEQQMREIEERKNQGTRYNIAEVEAELAEISHWNTILRELRDEKERIVAMQRNDLARFGASVPQIVSLIKQNAAKFSKEPIGPIGAYIRLKDDSWALAVERCLRYLLSVWLCDNVQDRNILDSILQKHNIRAMGYIISKFSKNRYDITLFEPPSEYLTVAKMITITDNNIFNVLVDQTQMESILLITSDSLARRLMAHSPPKNVYKGFTKNGDEVFAKTSNQVYRFYANHHYRKSIILTTNEIANTRTLNDQIVKAEDELQNNKISLAKKIEVDMNNEMLLCNQELQRLKVDNVRRRSLQKQLDAARFEGSVDGQVMNLLGSIQKGKEELLQFGKVLQQQLTKSRQLLHDVEMMSAEKAKEISENEEELKKMKYADLEEYSNEIDKMNDCENEHRQKLSKLEIHMNDLEMKVKVLNAPPDFASLPDTAEAEERCKKLERRVLTAQESLEGIVVSEETLVTAQNDYERLQKNTAMLNESFWLRNEKFLEVRNITADRLSELYSNLMSIRNFKGSLIINHGERAIYIMAETQKNQEIDEAALRKHHRGKGNLQDLRGLSGGERTYTSACFVMALWQAMETPIRCMDEFDVFLDLNNRKIVMELFADLATRQYPSHQFIFLLLKESRILLIVIVNMLKMEHEAVYSWIIGNAVITDLLNCEKLLVQLVTVVLNRRLILGLRSRVLHEKMATIVNMTTFLRENPFPFSCNELRLCIVRVVGECSTELRLVFSNDEVARRVLKVSHSNDPLARSLTLQVLAKLASVVAENKQIHHLVVSSIDSEEAQERLSAIVATEAFVAVSRSFSQTVFEKLCITFLSPLISPTTKIGLVGVFANMQADVEIIMKVFALGERILNEAYNQQLMLALINSLTTLAVSCKFAVSELLTLLIEKLKISKENRTLCVAILYNIKRLSSAAHMLTKSHMHDLLSFGDTLTDDLIRVYWLITLVRFTSRSIHKIIAMLSDNIAHWTYLLSSRNDDVRLAVLHLFINIYKYSQKSDIISTLKSSFIISLPTVKSQDSERFYRLLTAFICDDSCPRETVDAIVDALLIVPLPDFSALHVLQFLVAAAEIHSHLYSRLRIWSLSKLNENTNLTKLTVKSFQTRIWLIALRDICCASLSEFNVFSLEKSIESLNSARLSLSTLCSSREFIRYFIFPLRFVDCLCNMYAALRSFLVVINTNLLLNDKPAPYIMKKVSTRLQTCAIKLHKCRDMWLDLYKHCFDADASTMTFVELYSGMCALFSAALQLFVKQQPLSPLSISSSSHYSLANKRLRISLLWAKREIEKLDIITLEKRITRKLNVLPQPGPTDTAIAVSSNQKLPISIEGAIESSHASSVDAVIVKAVAKFARGSSKNGSQIQTVTPQEGKFFNAQFLLAFPQSCTMEFSVNFWIKKLSDYGKVMLQLN
ncbi:hypothetical protein DINM_005433 [Dirofilaria immitis]|nr:hypothetical protein [Dirofilaria immitis]